ncbi:HlyD family type I secretion periplasmic adaptor subunit [Bradyrhizobium jicamae]|uniref:Membrane fusion protein (MFP) family protein n=1 Tax=Bradyrhizobium jicamae TaxID=280332 RepID=A0ABS5FUS8_9BRAD|nr:HlyD family type I secretion periplasmic adaptor subunit [Bradyrhizobium jicamae]MBR0800501.1 HlyD family type I secretion periplasmic adaptor subunit [Bradyrhizobium jicamae]
MSKIALVRTKASPSKSLVIGSDREFLPAALEILETPPPPLPLVLMSTICAFAIIALAWSYFGYIDIHAVAQGKIQPSGLSKVIQPFDAGKVISLSVQNGTHVRSGDELIAFDPTENEADAKGWQVAISAAVAEILRRRRAIEKAHEWPDQPLLPAPAINWTDQVLPMSRPREEQILLADLSQLGESLRNIEKQIAEKKATIERLNMSISFQTELIKTLQDRVLVREQSLKLEVGTKINLFDALESLDKSRSALASDQGQLLETRAAIEQLESQKDKTIATFVADNATKLAEAERKRDDAIQQYAKSRAKLERSRLYAPVNGTVQQLAVTTLGQVVTIGQQLMTIVPDHADLQVEVYVTNADIGFIRVGQEAVIKLDAFPFTRFGTLHGKVISVATDAIDEQTARRLQANPISAANSPNAAGTPSGQPQNFVFPVLLSLGETTIKANDALIPLIAGMTLTAEIKTDRRRIIDYLVSPLAKVASEALRER